MLDIVQHIAVGYLSWFNASGFFTGLDLSLLKIKA